MQDNFRSMIETSATHGVPKGWSDQFSWEKWTRKIPHGGYDGHEPWNMNLCSPVQKPDGRDEKGYSKEMCSLSEGIEVRFFFPMDALQQINLLKQLWCPEEMGHAELILMPCRAQLGENKTS